ncbi:2-oxoacid:ferredoxin oxidoreductase subunit gamma [Thermosipho melanesiensis]|uniref:Pyruvate ferredoxin/flavodoxin oxidoreductase n=2 Tax=Thermosipho melanesiensis TaxID=46541 RepID=A6LJ78_THEM4|nr:2-oxoacid:acceptor oxidoreductase family protein [Thermosipho melanesiensis]ABR29979.1 pyruvate ferredoxin/flavodoxin oxidoreductase [Thermosipho melanesiensis BI429]APT73183.1 2-oxoacid:ferredoxin oxidoreductase subunit gamma [Thermosipho melanesiensis]OOC38578.1 2-oxoacid:ferredoxin oxidoreductase subunit gamma [Thermosipho melanesiensis]OOC40382.1 2-oxoacid:ferredoxin oxidoreductase subunit gamma [Thermosipho melanesiensis]OOC40646.1 2-oxoacid:ferredoxin oxidoreductase subunit gamma [The
MRFIFAGFGGQGVMLMGQILAYAGMIEGKNVTWMPSYGPEMRGGTANCTVVVEDKEVASPVVDQAEVVVAMNIPSMLKFQNVVTENGYLFLNESVIDREADRKVDINIKKVPCNEIADKLGNLKVANMVMLGAVIGVTNIVSKESLFKALEKKLTGKKANLIEVNKKAIEEGIAIAKQ